MQLFISGRRRAIKKKMKMWKYNEMKGKGEQKDRKEEEQGEKTRIGCDLIENVTRS